MPIKSPLITDFDSRRVLFHKVVDSLGLLPSLNAWDLSWGEPFLALSPDRKLWVRVFYEESLPITIERLRIEAERLRPHLVEGGQLVLCIPEVWAKGISRMGLPADISAQVWSYAQGVDKRIVTRELASLDVVEILPEFQPMGQQELVEKEEKLTSDEVRELTEMGVELKRYLLKKAG